MEIMMLVRKGIFFVSTVNIKCRNLEKDLSGLDHLQKCKRMHMSTSEDIICVLVLRNAELS